MTARTAPSRLSRTAGLLVAAIAACMLLVGVPSAAGQLIPSEKPPEIRGMELQNKLGQKLPLRTELTDSNGKTVSLGSKFGQGRPVVVAMIYLRCPLLCPQTQQRIIGSFNGIPGFTIGTDYDVLFISFDPRDSAATAAAARDTALLSYDRAATEPVRAGFSYMVGAAENTQAVADALGFPYRYLPSSGEFSHGTAVYVVSPDGVITNCFTKLDYAPKDLRLALVDASGGKIGTLLDTFTLWCYHSTITGEYTVAAMKVMRLGAILGAVVLFAFVGFWAMRDRRRRRQLALRTGVEGAGGMENRNVALPGALGHSR